MNIAVFADVHGRILLCFKLCARWEQETGQKIDLILQAGDLGAYPALERLDRATQRYAERDPTELGFLTHFVHYDETVAAQLARTRCPLVFVRGNHEDQLWLDTLEQKAEDPVFSIDAYRRIWCLKSGVPYTFRVGDEAISILGIGRIARREQAGERGQEDESHLRSPKHIQPYEQERLARLDFARWSPDVLLTHDSIRALIYPDSGMREIEDVLARSTPCYHFFGHYGPPYPFQPEVNGQTLACKLAELQWERRTVGKQLEAGSMGVLRWHGREEQRLEIVDAPWFKEYSAFTWEHL